MPNGKILHGGKIVLGLICALLAGVLAVMCPGTQKAQAVTSAEVMAEAQAAYEALQQLNEQYSISSEKYDTAVMAQQDAKKRIEAATEQIEKLQKALGGRMVSMYRGDGVTLLDLLLGSKSFNELATNWDLLDKLNVKDAVMTQQTKELRKEIQEQEKVLAEQTKAAEAEKAAAQLMVASMEATFTSLSEQAMELFMQEQAYAGYAYLGGGGGYDSGYSWTYDPSMGNDILARAYEWLGKGNYSYGACAPGEFDCSGFVSYCLTGNYARIGSTYTFMNWSQTSDPQPGCVCVNEGHTGIYIGDGMMIHAASEGEGIIVGPVQDGMIYVQ